MTKAETGAAGRSARSGRDVLPEGLQLDRTSAIWTEETVPRGLLSAHRLADHVWGRLVVAGGRLALAFEDSPDETNTLAAGDSAIIAPARPHHVVLDGPVEFSIEFHRQR